MSEEMTRAEMLKYLIQTMPVSELQQILETEKQEEEDFTKQKLTPAQLYYSRSAQIPGSDLTCYGCGRSLVRDDDHANELMGGENQ